jgi:hypothetical protein
MTLRMNKRDSQDVITSFTDEEEEASIEDGINEDDTKS